MSRLEALVDQPDRSIPDPEDRSEQLVRRARSGNRAAWDGLYALYASTVHGVLVARAPLAEVDDLLQEVFVQAYRQLSTLRDETAFGSWLLAICRNRTTDHHRRSGRQPLRPAAETAVRPDAAEASAAAQVLAIILDLPEAYRETLTLRLVEGLNGPEIAARTGLTPGSVRVNLHRGMKQLRERLQARSDDHG